MTTFHLIATERSIQVTDTQDRAVLGMSGTPRHVLTKFLDCNNLQMLSNKFVNIMVTNVGLLQRHICTSCDVTGQVRLCIDVKLIGYELNW